MKTDRKPYLKLTLTLFASAALATLFYFLLANLDTIGGFFSTVLGILMPFLIGGVIAYILTPVCNFFEGKLCRVLSKRKQGEKLAKSLSVLFTLLLALLVIFAVLLLVIPALIESITSVFAQMPERIALFENWLLERVGENETLKNYLDNLTQAASTKLPEWISGTVLPQLQTLIGGMSAGVAGFVNTFYNLLIGIIVSIYLLGGRKTFARQGKKLIDCLFRKKWANAVMEEIRFANQVCSGFISGRLIDSLIIGLICFAGMLIFQIPYPVLISVIVGITNIIPFFGPWLGAIPSFLLILMTSPVKSMVFLVFILILQQFDGNFLGPKILGNTTGLSSFWVLFAILLCGGLFGFIGMLIGVPVFAVIYDIVCKLVNRGLERRRAQEQSAPGASGNCADQEGTDAV
ncbi:MAG: AI-2E family transporter [Oscillospiraceae bacterium]|nr:AI-2E family transporter [Oscillospiraceae bacterium]